MSNGTADTVLRLEDLRKEFPEPSGVLHVLRGITLSLRRGEIVMLMGPSGSGKTTLLQIAGCLIRATSGRVEIAGRDFGRARESERLRARRKHLGFVFQSFHLVDALTAYDNVALAQRLRRQPIQRKRIMEILDRLGIASKAQKAPPRPQRRRKAADRHRPRPDRLARRAAGRRADLAVGFLFGGSGERAFPAGRAAVQSGGDRGHARSPPRQHRRPANPSGGRILP